MTEQRSSPTAIGSGAGVAIVALLALMVLGSALEWTTDLLSSLSTLTRLPLTRALTVSLAALAPLLILAAAALTCLRVLATRRTLASRVSYLVLPTDDFDPSEEAVLRAAARLSRVRRSVLGWLDPRASAVRLRLDSGPDGRLLYRVQVAGRARSVVRSALTSLGSVELREEAPSGEVRP